MRSRSAAPCALSLLTCLLAFAASGDDFCLPRLVFAPASTASHSLPLDDPNTDSLAPTSAAPAGRFADDGYRPNLLTFGPAGFVSTALLPCPSVPSPLPPDGLPFGPRLGVPLRC